jgi:hypothetical protein
VTAKHQLGAARPALPPKDVKEKYVKDPPPAAAPNPDTAQSRHEPGLPEPEKEAEKDLVAFAQNPDLAGHQTAPNAAAHVLVGNAPVGLQAEDAAAKLFIFNSQIVDFRRDLYRDTI